MLKNDEILTSIDRGVGIITLNRPERKNAFTMSMINRWAGILSDWRTDEEVKAIVLHGAGDAFCSGADFSPDNEGKSGKTAYDHKCTLWEQIHRIALTLEDIDKPVIAAMNGVAVGAGLDMALMCDMRFAADTARFSEGYVKVGLVPGDGGAYYLPRIVGISKALELLLTGDFIDASTALRIGMVNRVYPAGQLMEETLGFAAKLAAGPSAVIRVIKRATYQSSRLDLRTSLDLISSHMGVIRETKDSQEAMKASLDRLSKSKRG